MNAHRTNADQTEAADTYDATPAKMLPFARALAAGRAGSSAAWTARSRCAGNPAGGDRSVTSVLRADLAVCPEPECCAARLRRRLRLLLSFNCGSSAPEVFLIAAHLEIPSASGTPGSRHRSCPPYGGGRARAFAGRAGPRRRAVCAAGSRAVQRLSGSAAWLPVME